MIEFINGKKYPFAIRLCPPQGKCVPLVSLFLFSQGRNENVIGKMDTGAFKTMLNEETADILGITIPTDNSPGMKKCYASNGNDIPYWEQQIYFVFKGDIDYHLFPIRAGFSRHVTNNLFGCDFLDHFCLGIDQKSVHFLR